MPLSPTRCTRPWCGTRTSSSSTWPAPTAPRSSRTGRNPPPGSGALTRAWASWWRRALLGAGQASHDVEHHDHGVGAQPKGEVNHRFELPVVGLLLDLQVESALLGAHD